MKLNWNFQMGGIFESKKKGHLVDRRGQWIFLGTTHLVLVFAICFRYTYFNGFGRREIPFTGGLQV